MGLMPLLPFFMPTMDLEIGFTVSAFTTAVAFFAVGSAKGWVLRRSMLASGFETLLIGTGTRGTALPGPVRRARTSAAALTVLTFAPD